MLLLRLLLLLYNRLRHNLLLLWLLLNEVMMRMLLLLYNRLRHNLLLLWLLLNEVMMRMLLLLYNRLRRHNLLLLLWLLLNEVVMRPHGSYLSNHLLSMFFLRDSLYASPTVVCVHRLEKLQRNLLQGFLRCCLLCFSAQLSNCCFFLLLFLSLLLHLRLGLLCDDLDIVLQFPAV